MKKMNKPNIALMIHGVLVEDYDFHGIHDIQQKIKCASWNSIDNMLKILHACGVVERKTVGKRKLYKWNAVPLKFHREFTDRREEYIRGLETRLFQLRFGYDKK
jgi:hypothetical protein